VYRVEYPHWQTKWFTVNNRKEKYLSSNMPEFRELGGAGVLPRKPRVSENGPKHIVWKFDGFYLGGQGMRRAKAILGQRGAELA
jgi:hypothetical protein